MSWWMEKIYLMKSYLFLHDMNVISILSKISSSVDVYLTHTKLTQCKVNLKSMSIKKQKKPLE